MPFNSELEKVYNAETPAYGRLLSKGTTVPVDGTAGYAPGCIFQHIDGSANGTLYVNEGSNTSCDFNAVPTSGSTLASATVTDLTATTGAISTLTLTNPIVGQKVTPNAVTASATLNASDTGEVFYVNTTSAVAITLPTAAAGLDYTIFNQLSSDVSVKTANTTTQLIYADSTSGSTSVGTTVAGAYGRLCAANTSTWLCFSDDLA